MITLEQFRSECEKIIKPEDKATIEKTKKYRKIFLLIALPITGIIGIILCFVHFIFIPFTIISVALIFVISSIKHTSKIANFKNDYASDVINILLKDYKYTFNSNDHIKENIFKNSPLSKFYENFKGEDLLTINIPNDDNSPSDVVLQVCDIKTTKKEIYYDSEGERQTRTVTVYEGVYGYVKFPFMFKCNLGIDVYANDLKRIQLEDIEFNKNFYTYTNDQLEALVILTPTLMQKLIKFNKKNSSFKLFLDKNGELHFGMYKNLFKVKLPKNKPLSHIFDGFYNDIASILTIIKEIKTNDKIFKI